MVVRADLFFLCRTGECPRLTRQANKHVWTAAQSFGVARRSDPVGKVGLKQKLVDKPRTD